MGEYPAKGVAANFLIMPKITAIEAVHGINRLVFTTREIANLCNTTLTSATQCLKRLETKKVVKKITHGLWGLVFDKRFSPFLAIPFLSQQHRSYLSFTSALHIHGVISQSPKVITVASTAPTKKVFTAIGEYHIHQISPDFFDGFDWNGNNDYLIATPEKAFVDCLYIASRKSRQFAHFPELDISSLNQTSVHAWIKKIRDQKIRTATTKGLAKFTNNHL